ncbi:MAG TPA: hypothetical protein VMM17_05280 [Gemmatimonadaceae bacterium]|nr:hypothetical protein [Gemmatimonadaceae bacterium]
MAESSPAAPPAPGAPVTPPPPRRGPGHRGQDIRDTVAEMAAKAQEISMEAGSKMAAAMKDVITAAAGLSSFAIESARDLVQYMVRRGQMTQDEADKLIREVEEAQSKRKGARPTAPAEKSAPRAPATARAPAAKPAVARAAPARPARPRKAAAAKPAARAKAPAAKPAKKAPSAKAAGSKKPTAKTRRR